MSVKYYIESVINKKLHLSLQKTGPVRFTAEFFHYLGGGVLVHVYVCKCAHYNTYVEARGQPLVIVSYFATMWENVLFSVCMNSSCPWTSGNFQLHLPFPHRFRLELQGSLCPIITWVLRSDLKSSCLYNKQFDLLSISPSSFPLTFKEQH